MDGQRDQARQLMQLIRADKKCKRKKGERERKRKKYSSIYISLFRIVHAFSIKSFAPDGMTAADAIRSALVRSFHHIYRTSVSDWLTRVIYRRCEKRISIYLSTYKPL